MPMVKSALALDATWPIFSYICWRLSTLGIHCLIGTFHHGELHIHLGGDLGGFHCHFEELVVDISTWNPLEARRCTFDSSSSFFDGDAPISWAYVCWRLVHVALTTSLFYVLLNN
jgi:hypothetical protein